MPTKLEKAYAEYQSTRAQLVEAQAELRERCSEVLEVEQALALEATERQAKIEALHHACDVERLALSVRLVAARKASGEADARVGVLRTGLRVTSERLGPLAHADASGFGSAKAPELTARQTAAALAPAAAETGMPTEVLEAFVDAAAAVEVPGGMVTITGVTAGDGVRVDHGSGEQRFDEDLLPSLDEVEIELTVGEEPEEVAEPEPEITSTAVQS